MCYLPGRHLLSNYWCSISFNLRAVPCRYISDYGGFSPVFYMLIWYIFCRNRIYKLGQLSRMRRGNLFELIWRRVFADLRDMPCWDLPVCHGRVRVLELWFRHILDQRGRHFFCVLRRVRIRGLLCFFGLANIVGVFALRSWLVSTFSRAIVLSRVFAR